MVTPFDGEGRLDLDVARSSRGTCRTTATTDS
jgi:hypothetical protein